MKKKTRHKYILPILIGLLIGFFLPRFISKMTDKVYVAKNSFINNYYDKQLLNKLFETSLGNAYTGDLKKDFDSYIIKEIMNNISKNEDEKFAVYNNYFGKEKIDSIKKTREDRFENMESKSINDSTFYIKLTTFRDNYTYKYFKSMINDMEKYNNLIIDLRGNTGGYMDEMSKIVNHLIPKDSIIYRVKTFDIDGSPVYSKTIKANNSEKLKFDKICILMDSKTASASEVLIASLKSNLGDNVITFGTNSYGKDIQSATNTFNDGTGLFFISGIMDVPNQDRFNENGLTPDITIGNPLEFYDSIEDEVEREEELTMDRASQLNEAIKYIQTLND